MVGEKLSYIFVASIAFFVTYIITPFIARVGIKENLVDKPGYRKIHRDSIPNLGGIVIFFGFILSILFVVPVEVKTKGLLAGSVIILLLGIVDDIVDLRPRHKFLIQTLPALLLLGYNYQLINQFINQLSNNIALSCSSLANNNFNQFIAKRFP